MASYEDTLKSFSLRSNNPAETDWVGQRAMTNPSLSGNSFAAAPSPDILTKQTAQNIDLSQPEIGAMQASPNAAMGVGGTEAAGAGAGFTPNMAMQVGSLAIGALKDINKANQDRINAQYAAKLAQINQDQANYHQLASVYKV